MPRRLRTLAIVARETGEAINGDEGVALRRRKWWRDGKPMRLMRDQSHVLVLRRDPERVDESGVYRVDDPGLDVGLVARAYLDH